MSPHDLIRGLTEKMKHPVTATSFNLSGGPDSYTAGDVAE